MTTMKHYTAEEVARIEATIENAFEFVRDVLEEPSVLETIPNGSEITLSPIGARTIGVREVARTKRFSVGIKRPIRSRMIRQQSGPTHRRYKRSNKGRRAISGHVVAESV